MHSRDILKSSRRELLRRRAKIFAVKAAIIFFLFILTTAGFAWASKNERFLIKKIEIKGNQTVSAEEIVKIAEEKISGKYLFLFPKKNTYLYPGASVRREILNSVKKIKTVETRIETGNILSVAILERKPEYVWCPDMSEVGVPETPARCYFLDEDGFSFSEAPKFSGPVFFEIHGRFSLPNNDNFVGLRPLGDKIFRDIVSFKDSLEEIGLSAVSVVELKDRDLKFILKDGGAVLLNGKNDFSLSFRNFSSAVNALKEEGTPVNSLQYVDLRFGNKVFFKSK